MNETMKKVLYVLYQPYKWLIYLPLFCISTIIFASSAVILAFFVNDRIASYVGGVLWSRINSWMAPIWVNVNGKENINPSQSYVLIANHQSAFDIFVLYGFLGIDFKWVIKQEVRKIPAIGIGCEKVGHIFIDRTNHDSAIRSLNEAKKSIVNGTSVMFFPEGTRSFDGTIKKFKKGAFKMALDLDLPILPITIVGTKDILPNKTLDLFPGKVSMRIHEPIPLKGYSGDNIDVLANKAQRIMIDSINAYT